MTFNTTSFYGHLGADPEIRTVGDNSVASFRVAISEKWKSKNGENKEHTSWVTVESWGKLAELVQKYCHKGSPVIVSGKLREESWEDKKDGSKRSKIKVVADTVQFLGGKREGGQSPAADAAPTAAPEPRPAPAPDDAELPF